LGYFILAGVAVVVFALNEYFPNKSGRVVLIVLGGGVLAFLGALRLTRCAYGECPKRSLPRAGARLILENRDIGELLPSSCL
jgi:hypothetical protein